MSKINIRRLNAWQRVSWVHPFTCGSGNRSDEHHLDGEGVLVATESGWICPYCDYSQAYREFEEKISEQDVLPNPLEQLKVGRPERVLCAAIWYPDLPTCCNQPLNIDSGVVLCGFGHASVIGQVAGLLNLSTNGPDAPQSAGRYIDGFITTLNRFVEREEAFEIAKREGQIRGRDGKGTPYSEGELFSEDMH